MNPLASADLAQFQRTYRFAGGKLRRVRVRHDGERTSLEFTLVARTALRDLGTEPKPVRLRFRLEDVEEFRFQKRPGKAGGRISDARFGYFDGMFFINLDAFGLPPGEQPRVHDFRASDAYAAGRDLSWEVVVKKS